MSGIDDLLREVKRSTAPRAQLGIQFAVVTAVSATHVTLDFPGGSIAAPFLSSYTPAVNDKALLLVDKGRVVAIGTLA